MITRRRFVHSAAAAASLGALSFAPRSEALEEGQPSRTAQSTALQRAVHQLLEVPRVFDDPVALRMFGARGVARLADALARYRTESSRAMRAFLVLRSRYAEDGLAEAFRRGTRQYVVLGAGLDTFAYRNPHRGLRVFEVDHPTTQRWKRARLEEQAIELPRSLTFAPVDFEKQSLGDGLRRVRFDLRRPAFVSWLGVTIYLTKPAVMDTLSFVAKSCAPGSEIVFDFAPPMESLDPARRSALEAAAAQVARIGEPWISYFDPETLSEDMRAMGYSQTRVLAAAEANELYFRGRADGFLVRGSGRIMAARV